MDNLVFYDYALSSRLLSLVEYFESLPDLYENCKYPAYIEYVKLRKVFFDCDFAISKLSPENDLEKVGQKINSLSEVSKWNGISDENMIDFWSKYKELLSATCYLKYPNIDDATEVVNSLLEEEDAEEVLVKMNEYKSKEISKEEVNHDMYMAKKSVSLHICEFERNTLGDCALINYLEELANYVPESDHPEDSIGSDHAVGSQDMAGDDMDDQEDVLSPVESNDIHESDQTVSSDSSSQEEPTSEMDEIKPDETTEPRKMRKRRMWTPEEVNLLKKGVKRYGEGNWRRIQIRYLPERTNVMIKDKVRTMKFSKNPHDRKRIQKWIEYYSKQSKK